MKEEPERKIKCINCKAEHYANDRACPKYMAYRQERWASSGYTRQSLQEARKAAAAATQRDAPTRGRIAATRRGLPDPSFIKYVHRELPPAPPLVTDKTIFPSMEHHEKPPGYTGGERPTEEARLSRPYSQAHLPLPQRECRTGSLSSASRATRSPLPARQQAASMNEGSADRASCSCLLYTSPSPRDA